LSPGQCARDARMLLRGSGECVCVEDQSLVSEAHISESTASNVSSITLLIRCVSLCRSLSLPTCFIHGLRPDVGEDFNLSSTASVTNCRRGIPCAAAFDLARRKIISGISRVVFINSIFPYLWEMSQNILSRWINEPHAWPLLADIIAEFPDLTRDQIAPCLDYARELAEFEAVV
jgi:hypothetical protein